MPNDLRDAVITALAEASSYGDPEWEMEDMADAALSAMSEVRVKPLEWTQINDGLVAECVLGEYRVYPTTNIKAQKKVVYFYCPKGLSWTIGYYDGVQAAKADAQADYERRILSALTPTAPSMQEADQLTPQIVTKFAQRLERHGLELDRFDPELPDCVAVFRGGNITCYLPISRAIAGEGK